MKATEMLQILKVQNKRLFIVWLITFIAFIFLLSYTIWLLNDIETETNTIEIDDVETIDNSHIKIGNDIWEKSE